jgi:beta-galactosidase
MAFDTRFPEQLDVMGFNYNLKVIDEWHKAHPKTPSVGSETASTISTRGIYQTDKPRNWLSAYDVNHT